MNTSYTWNELLTLGGFLFNPATSTGFDFHQESRENLDFLRKVFQWGKIEFTDNYGEIIIHSPEPEFDKWVEILSNVGGRGRESGPPEIMTLEEVDIPVLAIVRHLNRLGIKTYGSCSGHCDKQVFNKDYAYVDLKDPTTAILTKKLIHSMGYKVSVDRHWMIRIYETHARLFKLGLEISKITSCDDVFEQNNNKREAVLEELLHIPGETFHENLVQEYLMANLPLLLDHTWQDDYGNILGEKRFGIGPTILLSAHMDIFLEILPESIIQKTNGCWKRDEGILGADDRAGIALIINILEVMKEIKIQGTIKVIFTVEEEQGQKGAEHIDPAFYQDVDYAISLDRRNGNDIITKSNVQSYCSEEYGKIFESVSSWLWDRKIQYKMTTGGKSDLRVWSESGIQSVNLSIGYYNEHTSEECLEMSEWHRVHDLVLYAIQMLIEDYQRRKRNGRR